MTVMRTEVISLITSFFFSLFFALFFVTDAVSSWYWGGCALSPPSPKPYGGGWFLGLDGTLSARVVSLEAYPALVEVRLSGYWRWALGSGTMVTVAMLGLLAEIEAYGTVGRAGKSHR